MHSQKNQSNKLPAHHHYRLRDRFMLFFVILAVVPVLVLSGVAIYLVDVSHRNDVSQLELQVIDQKAEEITKFLDDTMGILELRVGFEQVSDIELTAQQFLLEGLLEENRAFEEVRLINLAGQETAKLSRKNIDPGLFDVSELPLFTQARDGNQYISDVYYTLSGPMVTLSAPVRNKNNIIIQVVSAEVNLSALVRSVEITRFGTNGYVALLDREGRVIAHGAEQPVIPGLSIKQYTRIQRIRSGEVLTGFENQDRFDSPISHTAVVGAGKSIPALGWIVLAEWPLSDANGLINDIRNQAVVLSLIVIAAVLAIAPLFASRLVRPIRDLQRASHKIKEGDFSYDVNITTQDELEELGNAFNSMTKGLKRLQELKDEFVFIAAHELRTPVTAIRGYLSLIQEEKDRLEPSVQESLEIVWKANERLIELVHDILEIARSDAGRMTIEVAPTQIQENVQSVLDEIHPIADAKEITVEYTVTEQLPLVMADPARVKEIVMNFVSNAIKYNSAKGKVKIYHQVNADNVTTFIQDNGFGISAVNQKKLFEKFFRVKNKKTSHIEGTGLGLFITKELVEKMNGTVNVESAAGKGSTFSFSLPIAQRNNASKSTA